MKISIIGSCQSRDLFNSNFVENYKETFQVQAYYTMTSMLSVMSKPVKYNHHKLLSSGMNDNQKEHWYFEFEKPMLKVLESLQPDVLLMDFYADARYGARYFRGGYVVNRMARLKGKGIIKWDKIGIAYTYKKNTEDFFTMWKNSFDRFMEYANKKLPNTQIVINTVKGTNVALDREGKKYIPSNIKDVEVDEINKIWRKMDNYAIDKYKLKGLFFEKEYYLDPDYLFGLGVALVHFHKDYYTDCFNKLVEVTDNSKIKDKKPSHINLIKDSAFKKGISEWTHSSGTFEIVNYDNYNGIKFQESLEKGEKTRPQVWSKPIEIYGDGELEYTLSFYIKVDDLSVIEDEEVFFAIRTFHTISGIKSKDALEESSFSIKKVVLEEGKDFRFVTTIKPKGKFIRVAPFMFSFKPGVEYSRIKLERSSKVGEYKK